MADAKAAQTQSLDLLHRLAAEQNFAQARRLYSTMAGAKPDLLVTTSIGIANRDGRFGPMDWQLTNDSDAGSGFAKKAGSDAAVLSVFANAATTRTVASKLLYLEPGSYRFAATLSKLSGGDGGFLSWRLRCPADDSSTTAWTINTAGSSTQTDFTINAACSVQILDLTVSGGKGRSALEATVETVAITPQAH